MEKQLNELRKSYEKSALLESSLPGKPYELFERWFEETRSNDQIEEANAMGIVTIGDDGFPKSRIVLLKEKQEDSFVFYTNYTSEKAQAIDANSHVAIHFFWPALERQIIIKAMAAKVPDEQSINYFNSRPRGSQLGAWTSHQSSVISSREELETLEQFYTKKFEGTDVPRPDFWGGYECKAVSYEFWQGRPNRLHDRFLFEKVDNQWQAKRLAP
ncbi:pyridoxamine 5'-phosphate oxidase [Nonlabens ponticola]|uniref:Pyridoxine/pyridoxamine 5'-phosphate oxidase n=1 Tax=Nonlabens ponticola TaxID=2496866 RepID=A0A3S9MZX8_9FLAO|nr:pyridoxamine 5'-phosphate oxidase [Nonlabens ponticola]AZQ44633.1 pyridoxamine 5'-phosphate oxidase [Nonlabens ponticola]